MLLSVYMFIKFIYITFIILGSTFLLCQPPKTQIAEKIGEYKTVDLSNTKGRSHWHWHSMHCIVDSIDIHTMMIKK